MTVPFRAALAALACAACGLASAPAPAQPPAGEHIAIQPGLYRFDPTHVSVTARVMHQNFSFYTFRFDRVRGELNVNATDALASALSVELDAASVSTGLPAFDGEVAGFLGAATTPTIAFRSERIERVDAQHARVHGQLTMNGRTAPVVLNARLNRSAPNMFGRQTMGFSVTGAVSRTAFGVATGLPLDDAGDEVSVVIEAEMRRVEPRPAPAAQ